MYPLGNVITWGQPCCGTFGYVVRVVVGVMGWGQISLILYVAIQHAQLVSMSWPDGTKIGTDLSVIKGKQLFSERISNNVYTHIPHNPPETS